jgi:hypothetical protein
MPNDADACLNDDERLAEVGRILATGVMRIIKSKNNRAAKTPLAGGEKTGLIVREKFANGGCYAKHRKQISRN